MYLLSIDPGFVNLGWALISVEEGRAPIVSEYGVYNLCPHHCNKTLIEHGIKKFRQEIYEPRRSLIAAVAIEDQPQIPPGPGNSYAIANHNLQMIEMCLRVIWDPQVIVYLVNPASMRRKWSICTGNYGKNKICSVDLCRMNNYRIDHKQVPGSKANHVCDAILIGLYYTETQDFSNSFKIKSTPLIYSDGTANLYHYAVPKDSSSLHKQPRSKAPPTPGGVGQGFERS